MRKRILLILSLGFVLGINLYFRTFPINFPQLKAEARNAVEQRIRNIAIQDVQKKFPQFYPSAREKIVKTQISEYKKLNKRGIEVQVKGLYERIKDKFQDDSGQTYLFELDCWHWGRYVENVVLYGHPGDEVIYGKQWDLFMLAPWGMYLNWEQFLYYFSAYLYKIYNVFKPVRLYTFLFYVPIFFAALFIITLYFFSFRLGGYIAAVTSCLFVGLAPMFLPRSCAGWFDRDILNLLFPLLIIWPYATASLAHSFRNRLFWICVSASMVGLFCFTWTHWWFIFAIVIIYEGISILSLLVAYIYYFRKGFTSRENTRLLSRHVSSLVFFILFSFLWILILAGPVPIERLYKQLEQAVALTKPLMVSVWPNVYYTVGELRRVNIKGIANSIGGPIIFTSAVLSMVVLLVRALVIPNYDYFKRTIIVIFAVWFTSMFFASLRGVRFVVFLFIPLGISLGWALNELYEHF